MGSSTTTLSPLSAGSGKGVPIASDEVLDLVDHSGIWIDLLAHVKRVAVAPEGMSVKNMAKAAGFSWRAEDPGGMALSAVVQARSSRGHVYRDRLIAYNEDDVRATLAVREWLTNQALPTLPDR